VTKLGSDVKIKRREFLRRSAIVVAGVSAAAAGITVTGLAAEWTAKLLHQGRRGPRFRSVEQSCYR